MDVFNLVFSCYRVHTRTQLVKLSSKRVCFKGLKLGDVKLISFNSAHGALESNAFKCLFLVYLIILVLFCTWILVYSTGRLTYHLPALALLSVGIIHLYHEAQLKSLF